MAKKGKGKGGKAANKQKNETAKNEGVADNQNQNQNSPTDSPPEQQEQPSGPDPMSSASEEQPSSPTDANADQNPLSSLDTVADQQPAAHDVLEDSESPKPSTLDVPTTQDSPVENADKASEAGEVVIQSTDENVDQMQHTEEKLEASTENVEAGEEEFTSPPEESNDNNPFRHTAQELEPSVETSEVEKHEEGVADTQNESSNPFQTTEQKLESPVQTAAEGGEHGKVAEPSHESGDPFQVSEQTTEPPFAVPEAAESERAASPAEEGSNDPFEHAEQTPEPPTTEGAGVGESQDIINAPDQDSDPAQHAEQTAEAPVESDDPAAAEGEETANAANEGNTPVQHTEQTPDPFAGISGADESQLLANTGDESNDTLQHSEGAREPSRELAEGEEITNAPDESSNAPIQPTEEMPVPSADVAEGDENAHAPIRSNDQVRQTESPPATPTDAVDACWDKQVSDKEAGSSDRAQHTEPEPKTSTEAANVGQDEGVVPTQDDSNRAVQDSGEGVKTPKLPVESVEVSERSIDTSGGHDSPTQTAQRPEPAASYFNQSPMSTSIRQLSPSSSEGRRSEKNHSPKQVDSLSYAPPTPKKADNSLASSLMSPMASPAGTPKAVVPSAPPSTDRSFATALHSPAVSNAETVPPYSLYQDQTAPNMTPSQRPVDPYYASSFQAVKELSMNSAPPQQGKGTISPPEVEREDIALLQRIQDAIPDINRLLSGFKDTQGKLSTRETEIKQIESQHEQALVQKDYYIDALQAQMKRAAADSAEESTNLKNTIYRLKFEVQNLQEKQRELEENLSSSENSNKKLAQSQDELEGQISRLNASAKEAQELHEKEIDKQKQERKVALAAQKQELTDLFEEIKAEDGKAAAEALKVREEELNTSHSAEIRVLRDTHSGDLDNLRNTHEAATREMDEKFTTLQTQSNEKEQRLVDKVGQLEEQLSESADKLSSQERENQKLEEIGITKERQLQRAAEELHATINNLGGESERMRKTLQSLGEATDLKSTKGDSFFLDCFGQLSRLIVDISKEHFAYLPIDPPKDILSKIPSELPPFLDNTRASRELRSAYVQHVISKTLTYRIFQPFIFTLGKRYDKADTFFQLLSMDIRRKSVRREAFWRQQTLKAAYTTSDAKQSINVAAAVIVDEIVDHIRHFADPKQLDSLLTGVKMIVKLAAETWRHARVERELVLADLPAAAADGIVNEEWEEHGHPQHQRQQHDDLGRRAILRTFPRVVREAAHEDFAEDKEKAAGPCVYSPGIVVYADSPVVTNRLRELSSKTSARS